MQKKERYLHLNKCPNLISSHTNVTSQISMLYLKYKKKRKKMKKENFYNKENE